MITYNSLKQQLTIKAYSTNYLINYLNTHLFSFIQATYNKHRAKQHRSPEIRRESRKKIRRMKAKIKCIDELMRLRDRLEGNPRPLRTA